MGFTPKRKTFVLDFEGTELDGLTVRARSVPLGQFLDLMSLATIAEKKTAGPEDVAAIGKLFEGFAQVITSWDLEDDDGAPVPATVDGLRTLGFDEAMLIVSAWLTAAGGVSAPLGVGSTGGAPSVVASLTMAPLSERPAS